MRLFFHSDGKVFFDKGFICKKKRVKPITRFFLVFTKL